MMNAYESVINKLNSLDIPFEIIEHPPAFTTAEADSYIVGIEGVRTKSMFLTNKKKTAFYLLIMDGAKRLDIDLFKEIVGANKVKMASPDTLLTKMNLTPGCVSIFGLMNNLDKDIQVYFDQDMLSEARMSFHPNVNTKTIFVATDDVIRFVEEEGFTVNMINI